MVQVIKDPIGTKGARLSTQISIAGRLLVFLPQDNHIGISQKIGSHELREQLRARMQRARPATPARRRRRRLHPAHQRRGRERRRAGRRHRLPAQDLGAHPRARASQPPPASLLHQDLSLPSACCATWPTTSTQTIRIDSREQFDALRAVRPRVHAERGRQAAALQGRAADLRPVQRSTRRSPRALAPPRRPEVRRLPDRRPDRGADHDRRQHRRLRRRAQLRRHDLQDQPRGGAGASRASCACATWAASSSSTSSTWRARTTARRCWPSSASSSRATARKTTVERLLAARAWWR